MWKKTAMPVLILGMVLFCCSMVFGAGRRDKSVPVSAVEVGTPGAGFHIAGD